MKLYQGVDIVDISRFREVTLRNRDFIADVFTEREREYCRSMKDPYRHFAGRFAAKESCLKALGIGKVLSSCDMRPPMLGDFSTR